jgi:hypothetical protein
MKEKYLKKWFKEIQKITKGHKEDANIKKEEEK